MSTSRNQQRKAKALASSRGISYQQALRSLQTPDDPFAALLGQGRGLAETDRVRAYLFERGFTEETIAHFELSRDPHAPDPGRLGIPLHDAAGHPVPLASRALYDSHPCSACGERIEAKEIAREHFLWRRAQERAERVRDWRRCPRCGADPGTAKVAFLASQTPKYLFRSDFDKSSFLYHQRLAFSALGERAEKALYLVEGFSDAWACWQAGAHAVCAYLGASLSDIQAARATACARTTGKPVVLAADFDRTGQASVQRNIHALRSADPSVRVRVLRELKLTPACKDCGQVLERHGEAKLRWLLSHRHCPATEWQVRAVIDAVSPDGGKSFYSPESQRELVAELLRAAPVHDRPEALARYLARAWALDEREAAAFIVRARAS